MNSHGRRGGGSNLRAATSSQGMALGESVRLFTYLLNEETTLEAVIFGFRCLI